MPPFLLCQLFGGGVGGCLRTSIVSQIAAKEKLPSRLLLLPGIGSFCQTVRLEVFSCLLKI